MTGRRIPAPPASWEEGQCPYGPGDYWKDADGHWHGVTPNGINCYLKNHHVEEHADGTITIVAGTWGSNSILAGGHDEEGKRKTWHGYIRSGVWEAC